MAKKQASSVAQRPTLTLHRFFKPVPTIQTGSQPVKGRRTDIFDDASTSSKGNDSSTSPLEVQNDELDLSSTGVRHCCRSERPSVEDAATQLQIRTSPDKATIKSMQMCSDDAADDPFPCEERNVGAISILEGSHAAVGQRVEYMLPRSHMQPFARRLEYSCPFETIRGCSRTFHDFDKLCNHVQDRHRKHGLVHNYSEDPFPDGTKKIPCPNRCGHMFTSYTQAVHHAGRTKSKRPKCPPLKGLLDFSWKDVCVGKREVGTHLSKS